MEKHLKKRERERAGPHLAQEKNDQKVNEHNEMP